MITITVPFDNTLNQKTYENTINSLQFHQLQCTCGHSGCLTIHGYYTRSLKADDSVIPLSICRVKCSQCGKTHALLPSLLVPYSQVSLQDQVSIISTYEDSGDYGYIMEKTPSIDENLIASIIRRRHPSNAGTSTIKRMVLTGCSPPAAAMKVLPERSILTLGNRSGT